MSSDSIFSEPTSSPDHQNPAAAESGGLAVDTAHAQVEQTPAEQAQAQQAQGEEKWLTPVEAAALRGVTRAAIYKAVSQGRLPHRMMLGRIALQEADVLAWAASGAKAGRPRGIPMTETAKVKVAQAQHRRWKRSEV